ncbi:MAG: hypothetical protein WHT06_16220 [Desulfobacterales bacterium]
MEWWEKKKEEWRKLCNEWGASSWKRRLRLLENLIDDPVDDLKHKIHGAKIFGVRIYLPRWLMRGAGRREE